jgi:bacillithiol biosynthesis cysteine-adding enzyme BshC
LEEGQVLTSLAPVLAEVLKEQNDRYGGSPARDAHLRALRDGAQAIVTGQQAGLFLGPLYTLYKAATAIRVARARGAVPVFWLQTEDHDLAEIAATTVLRSQGGALRLALPAPPEPVAVAHRRLPEDVEAAREALADVLGGLPHAAPHLERLARHYRAGKGWSEAFGGMLAELFAEEGLLLLDPRDPRLAPLAAPVHRRALVGWREVAAILHASGAPETVHVRDDAPLSFFHPDGPQGRRCRLRAQGEGLFEEIGGAGTHTLDELLRAIDTEPMRFSTSALLRPILQDTWLPGAAYVGGPAEVRYFEQLGPLHDWFGLPRPEVLPRAAFTLLEESDRKRLQRTGITVEEAARPLDEALASLRGASREGERVAAGLLQAFDAALAEIEPTLEEAGERARRAAEKTRGTVARAVEKLAENVDTAWRLRDQALVEDLTRLRERLFPDGVPQERVYGPSSFLARHGERTFVDRIVAAADPGGSGRRSLEL